MLFVFIRRIGKKYCLKAALTLFTTGALGVVVLPAVTEAIRLEICCALFLGTGTGFAGAQLMPQAMFADILRWTIAFGFSGISGISIIAALILTTCYAPTEGRVHQSKIALRV
ncbi:hypothetical protein ABTW96_23815 [Nocardia beijingensis]|uniref:hypothetical protein n=1 Tax=Nocardia beijingensis TaxID=95162 RepID=UPI0033277FD1